jgi:hypothetical protein
VIRLHPHAPVRHLARVVELVARHFDHAGGGECAEPELDRGVDGVHGDHAVGVELVVVDVRRERPDRHRPDAVVAFRHRMCLAVELADDGHFLGVRGAEAERHRAIRADLGRDHRRPAPSAAASLTLRRRGRPRRRLWRLRAPDRHCHRHRNQPISHASHINLLGARSLIVDAVSSSKIKDLAPATGRAAA